MTFVVTVRRVSPSLEKMINFCYLHYCPEGSSIGPTHLSFPLHCFSNGNEIECTASWVRLAKTLLSREGAGKMYLLIIKQPCMALQQSHSAKSFGSSKQLNNLEGYEDMLSPFPQCSCLIRALIAWVQSINQP